MRALESPRKAGQGLPRPDEGVLGDVVGVVGAHQVVGQAPHVGLAGADGVEEGGAVAVARGEEQPRELVHGDRRYWREPLDPQRRLPRMTCMQIHQAISARLDGEDPGLDESTVYAHLAGCADCRAFSHRRRVAAPQRAARPRARDPRPHAGHPHRDRCRIPRRCRRPCRARHEPRAALDPAWPSRSRRSRWRSPRSSSAATPACRCTPPATSARSTSRSASGSSTRRGSRRASPGCCRWSPRWSCASWARRSSTSPTGSTRALGEVQHVLDFVGLAVVWLLSRPAPRRVQLA